MDNTAICKRDRTLKSNKADWLNRRNSCVSGRILTPVSSTGTLVKELFEQGCLFGLKNIAIMPAE